MKLRTCVRTTISLKYSGLVVDRLQRLPDRSPNRNTAFDRSGSGGRRDAASASPRPPARRVARLPTFSSCLPSEYVYLLGLYLGDGCLSRHPRGVYKLRVVLDSRYPGIVAGCEAAMQAVLPGNRPGSRLGTWRKRRGGLGLLKAAAMPFSAAWSRSEAPAHHQADGVATAIDRTPSTAFASRTDPFRRLPFHEHSSSLAEDVRVRALQLFEPVRGHPRDLLRRLRPPRRGVAGDERLEHLGGAAGVRCAARRVHRSEDLTRSS